MKRNEGVADLIEQTGREEAEFIAVGSRHFSQITARPCIVLRCSRISYVVRKFVASFLRHRLYHSNVSFIFPRGQLLRLGSRASLNTGSAAADRAALPNTRNIGNGPDNGRPVVPQRPHKFSPH
jgi:hypothetical protein